MIFSHSRIHRDPRLLRQIRWLREAGATSITTIGLGRKSEGVDKHHSIPVRSFLHRMVAYSLLRKRQRFNFLFGTFLDASLPRSMEGADLIVVNEVEYLPWVGFKDESARKIPTYLDLHEDHVFPFDRGFLEKLAFRKFGRWQFSQLKGFVASREGGIAISTVEETIARFYSETFAKKVVTIYNAPDKNRLRPSKVDASQIRLVHHGMGTKGKGIEVALGTLRLLEDNYSLDLILFATPFFALKVRVMGILLGVQSRLTIRRGVPLNELPGVLNDYDVAMVLLSDITNGHWNALPNKLFESIHSKLAIVTGPNPSMSAIVQHHKIGFSTRSLDPNEVARAVSECSVDDLSRMKSNCIEASSKLSSDQSRLLFLNILESLGTYQPK